MEINSTPLERFRNPRSELKTDIATFWLGRTDSRVIIQNIMLDKNAISINKYDPSPVLLLRWRGQGQVDIYPDSSFKIILPTGRDITQFSQDKSIEGPFYTQCANFHQAVTAIIPTILAQETEYLAGENLFDQVMNECNVKTLSCNDGIIPKTYPTKFIQSKINTIVIDPDIPDKNIVTEQQIYYDHKGQGFIDYRVPFWYEFNGLTPDQAITKLNF